MGKLNRNGSGYYDPTAFEAMKSFEREDEKMEIYRGDIFFVTGNGGKIEGSEVRQDRPAIIVSNDKNNEHSPVVEVVFLTSAAKTKWLPTHTEVLCQIPSTALCEQVVNISKTRLGDFVRSCTDEEMKRIDACLMVSLGLEVAAVGEAYEEAAQEKVKELKEEINDLNMMLKCSEQTSEERRKLLEESQGRLSGAIDLIEKLNNEIERLKEAPATKSNNPAEVVALTTERNLYKQQYEMLLERLIGA